MHPQQQDHYAHRREYHPVKRAPPVDMIEVGTKVQIVVELPGLKRENLKIDIHDKSHFLTLKGRYERDEYGEEANFLMNERTHGKFRRRIRLPQYADIDHVQANMKDGLLIIEMPSLKKHELFKKKRVISVEGLHPSEDLNTFSKARRFEWADQDRTQVSTATDTTVHHHVK
jgi:HSP20 family molecular chaperone IbpA